MGSSINKWNSLNIFDVTPIIKSVESSPMIFILLFMFILFFIGIIFTITNKKDSIDIEDESY